MKYFFGLCMFVMASLLNIAHSDTATSNNQPPKTNNILDKTKQNLNNSSQTEQNNLENGIQEGEGQPADQ